MKEEIHSLIEIISRKDTATSPLVDDPSIDKCMDILSNLPDIPEGSGIYNCTVNMFLKKGVRQEFLKMTTNEAQKSWLEYNYELYLKEIDIVLSTMAIHNYIRKKCNVGDAFRTAKNEEYIPSAGSDVGTSSRTNSMDVENVEEQSDIYWMRLRDMIANDICNA
ncbi:hypothetical protein HAX54_045376 [Datura stramonium]|uniref:Uncharacterized protein n=1 Tax=Datura stramonium TaxID=4076 RepID=A0ABS8SQ78_DATST|nr:hypothetical protein [Datura stramonium]